MRLIQDSEIATLYSGSELVFQQATKASTIGTKINLVALAARFFISSGLWPNVSILRHERAANAEKLLSPRLDEFCGA